MIFKKQTLALILGLLMLAAPSLAYGRGLVACGGYKDDGSSEKPCTVLDLFTEVAMVTNWLVAMAGVFAVFEIVSNAFWLTISMGNEEDITKRKGGLTAAIVGFVIVLIAYIMINTVINYLLLATAPETYRVDLKNPCTYLAASQKCVNPK